MTLGSLSTERTGLTSSKRSGRERSLDVREYKQFDPFCEPGLISILFLSCNRHQLSNVCLTATEEAVRDYDGEVEWLFLEQGHGEDAEKNIRMYRDFKTERKVIILPDTNYGINNGINSLWSVSRGQYCMIHECDWLNRKTDFNFLKHSRDILDQNTNVGIVQLRAVWDPNENWGLGKADYSPWSSSEAKVWDEQTEGGHKYRISEFPNGFNNNPIVMRKTLYRECGVYPEPPLYADPRHGETEYQARVASSGCAIAHIGEEVYYHIGGALRKNYEL